MGSGTRRRLATGATLLAAALGASFAFGAPAFAHSRLLATNPTDGAALSSPISEVDLTYNERVQGTFTTVVVNGPGGVSYSDGHVQVIDDVVHQKVYPLHTGSYTVAWRAISADGHPVEGQFHFSMTLPRGNEPTGMPPRPGAAAKPSGGHTAAWIGGAVAVLVVVAVVTVLAMRPRRRAADQRERIDDDMDDNMVDV